MVAPQLSCLEKSKLYSDQLKTPFTCKITWKPLFKESHQHCRKNLNYQPLLLLLLLVIHRVPAFSKPHLFNPSATKRNDQSSNNFFSKILDSGYYRLFRFGTWRFGNDDTFVFHKRNRIALKKFNSVCVLIRVN